MRRTGLPKGGKNIKMLTSSFKKIYKNQKLICVPASETIKYREIAKESQKKQQRILPKPDILTTGEMLPCLVHGLHYVSVNHRVHKQKLSDESLQLWSNIQHGIGIYQSNVTEVPLTLRDGKIVEQMMPPNLLKHHSGSKTYEVGGLWMRSTEVMLLKSCTLADERR